MNALMPSVVPFDAPFGAEVAGVDASRELDAAATGAVRDALDRHLVIVLRNQRLEPDDIVRFTAGLGELAVSVLSPYLLKENQAVSVISNIVNEKGENIGLPDAGPYWHTDGVYFQEPHAYTLLYALEVPHEGGEPRGDTQFASTVAAYEALSAEMKSRLQGLKAVQKLTRMYAAERMKSSTRKNLTDEQKAKNPDRAHPLIRTHPRTGRKCIYVNETYTDSIVGMQPEEGRALLDELHRHCTQPAFYYRHRWRVGDLVVWDNCATQHRSTFDYALPQRRLLYRTTVKGSVPC